MKIFHHDDLDGKCAANVIYKNYKTLKRVYDLKDELSPSDFIESGYNRKPDLSIVKDDEMVAILDYHIEPEEMKQLIGRIGIDKVIWIDHHKSNIEKYDNSDIDLIEMKGIRNIDYSGAYLTFFWIKVTAMGWEVPKTKPEDMYVFTPEYIKLVDQWDTFKWKKTGNVDAYHYMLGMNMFDLSPMSSVWENAKNDKETMIERGQIIAEYKQTMAKAIIKRTGFATELEGIKIYAANFPLCSSVDFEGIEGIGEYDIVAPFYRNPDGKYTVSLYSSNPSVDCSEIAKKYGGGGHKGASGFSVYELPFKKLSHNKN